MPTAAAIAHPNIALVKYWGKRDVGLNLASTPSVSVTLGPFKTTTEVTWGADRDELLLGGEEADGTRVFRHLDRIDPKRPPCRVVSENNFPTAAGLASSSSAFAALSLAATRAAGRELSPAELSVLARRGSGSACRSIHGGFVAWPLGSEPDGSDSHGVPIAPADHWDLAVVVAAVDTRPKSVGSTSGMLRCQETSPMYEGWVKSALPDYAQAVDAIQTRDLDKLGEAMERSTLKMHAAMLTTVPPLRYVQSASLAVQERVIALRDSGVRTYFTMDAGPNVKVLCAQADAPTVQASLSDIVSQTYLLTPSGPAHPCSPTS